MLSRPLALRSQPRTPVSPVGGTGSRASLSSESGESLRHVGCDFTIVGGVAGKRIVIAVMRSQCAGAASALDPPLWTVVPNKALSLSLRLSLSLSGSLSLLPRPPRYGP